MSEWRGLANPERHAPTSVTDMAWCNVCDGPCYSTEACCCCLAAEVKRLERAEAAIARVRELADHVATHHGERLSRIKPRDIYRALDGEQ